MQINKNYKKNFVRKNDGVKKNNSKNFDKPKAPKGKVEMIVSFKVNENAILEVSAREKN